MTGSLVRDVMTTEVVAAEPSTPFKEIAGRLAQHRISAVPVVAVDRHVLGIVTEADLLLKQEHPDPKATVPLIWTRRRRQKPAKAAAAVAGKLMTAPRSPRAHRHRHRGGPAHAHRPGQAVAGGQRERPAAGDRQPRRPTEGVHPARRLRPGDGLSLDAPVSARTTKPSDLPATRRRP
jgi:hypothetical protein